MTTNSFYGTYLGNAGAVGPANPLVAGNPFGPQFVVPLPLASVNSGTPMGNAGFFAGPQYEQQMPTGFQNKTVS
jgi:hypothetical protein